MANDLEQLLRDIFGEPINRVAQFQSEQWKKLQARLQELAREAVKDDFAHLHQEIGELRSRLATLEAERARNAAESVETPF